MKDVDKANKNSNQMKVACPNLRICEGVENGRRAIGKELAKRISFIFGIEGVSPIR